MLESYELQHDGDIVDVQIGAEVIQSTDGHPFWVLRGEGLEQRPEMTHCPTYEHQSKVPGRWVYAKDLRVGDELMLHGNETAVVDGLTIHAEDVPVYNFSVAELHSYAVGCSEVLVHNDNSRVTREWANRRFLQDRERIVRIAGLMRELGYPSEDIGRWIREAEGRALGRVTSRARSCNLPPWPAPWHPDYPQ